jgi:Ca2+-dependent lipid-binding protein
MPAVSEKQRELMAIAEHHPEKLHKENRGILKMSHKQLHDFASTKGLKKKSKGHYGIGKKKE